MQISALPPPLQGLAHWIDEHPSIGSTDETLTVEEVVTALQLGLIEPERLEAAQQLREKIQAEAKALGIEQPVTPGNNVFVPNPTSASEADGACSADGVCGLSAPAGTTLWPGLVEDDLDDEVDTSLLDEDMTRIGATASGEVFQLDSATVGAMTVRVRQIKDSVHGAGSEISARLTLKASKEIEAKFKGNLLEGAKEVDYTVEAGDFEDGATHLKTETPYIPKLYMKGNLKAYRIEEPGKWMVDYIQQNGSPQAYRDKLRIRVFGATDEERDANLKAAVERCGVPGMIADADSLQMERMRRLSALRMVAPQRAEEFAQALDAVELSVLDQALAEFGVDAARLADIDFEEVFPGHMAAVDPQLGEAYAKLGVRAIMVGVKQLDSAVRIFTSDGLMSSVERYSRGLHRAGASLTSDEASGGAEFAFTRLVTQKAIDGKSNIGSSFGAGECQLISVGERMEEQLSRTDWHAYPSDSYGISIADSQLTHDATDTQLASEHKKRQSKFSQRKVLGPLVDAINGGEGASTWNKDKWQTSNEACFKAGVPASAFTHAIVKTEAKKTELLQLLEAAGVTEIAGRPVAEAVLVATTWDQVGAQLGFPVGTAPDAGPQAIPAVEVPAAEATPASAATPAANG